MNIKRYVSAGIVLATMTTSMAVALPALADTAPQPAPATTMQKMMGFMHRSMKSSVVFGTVSSVNGNTIGVSGRLGLGTTTPVTTYSVDVTNAKVIKNNVASSASAITIGDTVLIQGSVSGSNVVASMVRDGVRTPENKDERMMHPGMASSTPIGDGQPVVAGTVSTIVNSTITITNKSGLTYTIDATNAKIHEGMQASTTISSITVGDTVLVQGAVNGTNIQATSIIDQKPSSSAKANGKIMVKGFFGGIGSFFSHIFGF